jgi:hypothetical protein
VATISRKEEQKQREQQQQANKGYWQNELDSLGIAPKQKKETNDDEELENLSHIIKQALFKDYKVAYSQKGNSHKREAQSTVAVDDYDIRKFILYLPS